MDPNKLLAVVFLGTAVMDLIVARNMSGRLSPQARMLLGTMGFGFLALGLAMVIGLIAVA